TGKNAPPKGGGSVGAGWGGFGSTAVSRIGHRPDGGPSARGAGAGRRKPPAAGGGWRGWAGRAGAFRTWAGLVDERGGVFVRAQAEGEDDGHGEPQGVAHAEGGHEARLVHLGACGLELGDAPAGQLGD